MKKKVKLLLSVIISASVVVIGVLLLIAATDKNTIRLDPDYNELFTKEEMKTKGHISILPEYTTDVSTAYKNEDGTKTLYVYAAPIRFYNSSGQLSLIDTRLTNIHNKALIKEGYSYTVANSDIQTCIAGKLTHSCGIRLGMESQMEFGVFTERPFPSKVTNIENFIGDRKMAAVYDQALGEVKSLYVYPSYLGVNCEIAYSDNSDGTLSFWLKLDKDTRLNKEPGGYLILQKDKVGDGGEATTAITGVIQAPLLKKSDGSIDEGDIVARYTEDDYWQLDFTFEKAKPSKDSRVLISFEMRREKQPDNALYSKLPDLTNAYLKNESFIGNSEEYGIGRLMIRFAFAKVFDLKPESILWAGYSAYNLTGNVKRYELRTILEDWCSMTGNWNKSYRIGEQTAFTHGHAGEVTFDLTREVKLWCDDPSGQLEHNGVLLKSIDEKGSEYDVWLSNDNSLYRCKTEIVFR